MKVLWFTNTLGFSLCTADLQTSGSWMLAMLDELRKVPDVEVGVVTAKPAKRSEYRRIGNIDAFIVPQNSMRGGWRLGRALNCCKRVVEQWKPDLVHVYGTERFYGLLTARRLIDTPAVISLQGLLGPYSKWYHFFGDHGPLEVARMHRFAEPFVLRGVGVHYYQCRRNAQREAEIIRGNRHFLSYTMWDRSFVASLNPSAVFHDVADAIRKPFWNHQWSIPSHRRFRLIFTNSGHPRKGTDVLLDAVNILRHDYPDIRVGIGGTISRRSGYGRYLRKRMSKLGNHVIELGPLNAKDMARELSQSHVFVSPSFIDNSPNAVCEAQLVGIPVVASYVGGVPSLVEEGKTGLLFPSGQAPVLAARVRQIFENDQLAQHLGREGQKAARTRNGGESVVGQLLSAYQAVLNHSRQLDQSAGCMRVRAG